MKIRSYKGPSVELLHDAIREEMGPDAVVVRPATPKELGGILRRQHELIAILDDSSSPEPGNLNGQRRNASLEIAKWNAMEGQMTDLQRNMRELVKSVSLPGTSGRSVPSFAEEWDSRFTRAVTSGSSDSFLVDNVELLRGEVKQSIRVKELVPIRQRGQRPQIIVLVGPTGCGKTTTMAKLAATWSIDGGLNIGLITADTFRIAAADQAKEYAMLLGLDLRVVFSAAEAKDAARSMSDKDVILVDTAGRSQFDTVGMHGLKALSRSLSQSTTILLIPAAAPGYHTSDIMKHFGILDPSYLIVTKVDETRRFGVFTTLACESNCPIAFLTNGQRVPEDIIAARADEIAEMLVPTSHGAVGDRGGAEEDKDGRLW